MNETLKQFNMPFEASYRVFTLQGDRQYWPIFHVTNNKISVTEGCICTRNLMKDAWFRSKGASLWLSMNKSTKYSGPKPLVNLKTSTQHTCLWRTSSHSISDSRWRSSVGLRGSACNTTLKAPFWATCSYVRPSAGNHHTNDSNTGKVGQWEIHKVIWPNQN